MGALREMMQGCGVAFTHRIDDALVELLIDCSHHTNRFVREYTYYALRNVFDVCETGVFLNSVAPALTKVAVNGIRDNWSQVRYAASAAVRTFMEKAAEQRDRFYPELLGTMCLNRHYVAEGVRNYSIETWKFIVGPQGGARLLMAHFDNVIDTYVEAAQAPNHAVREAACQSIAELAYRVAGTPGKPTPYRDSFHVGRVHRLLETLLAAFEDESWPVRDIASSALGKFVCAFPVDCLASRAQMIDLWFQHLGDNIPSVRKNCAFALASAVDVWPDELWQIVLPKLEKCLPEVVLQSELSSMFSNYTPSGPFSVPQPHDKADFTNQTMYSCGSGAPKTFKKKQRDRVDLGGCMNCSSKSSEPQQFWEISDGMVHLLAELANVIAKDSSRSAPERVNAIAAQLPNLAKAFACSHFRHHYLLKQWICERLPGITQALGPARMLPHVPDMLKNLVQCKEQSRHPALAEEANGVLKAWRGCFAVVDAEAACHKAGVSPSTLGVL